MAPVRENSRTGGAPQDREIGVPRKLEMAITPVREPSQATLGKPPAQSTPAITKPIAENFRRRLTQPFSQTGRQHALSTPIRLSKILNLCLERDCNVDGTIYEDARRGE